LPKLINYIHIENDKERLKEPLEVATSTMFFFILWCPALEMGIKVRIAVTSATVVISSFSMEVLLSDLSIIVITLLRRVG
jgi:hypothetical protein